MHIFYFMHICIYLVVQKCKKKNKLKRLIDMFGIVTDR